MRRKILFLFSFLFSSFSLMAQKDLHNLLIGSWEMKYHGSADKKVAVNSNDQNIYSFYKDSTFQQKIFYARVQNADSIELNSLTIIFGTWRRSELEDCLFLEHQHTRGDLQMPDLVDRYFCIGSLSDTIMIQKDDDNYNLFVKIPAIEKYQVNFIPGSKQIEYPNYKFYLTNAANPKKHIRLNNPTSAALYVRPLGTDSILSSFEHYYSGFIKDLNDSMLTFDTSTESIDKKETSGYETKATFNFNNEGPGDSNRIDLIKTSSIKYIDYMTHTENVINNLTFGAMFFSGVALVAAPLFSLNYKNFKIDGDRYVAFSLAGLAGFAVSIPINLITSGRKYNIIRKNASHDKYHWYLTKEAEN